MAKKYSKSYINNINEWYDDLSEWVENVIKDNPVVSIYIAGHKVEKIKSSENDKLIDCLALHIKYKFEELGSQVVDYLQSQFGAKSYLITNYHRGEWRITFFIDNYSDPYHMQSRTGQWTPKWRRENEQ